MLLAIPSPSGKFGKSDMPLHMKLMQTLVSGHIKRCEGNSLFVNNLCFSAVHRCFFTLDKTHIASFSDDKSVCLWDIPSESKVTSFCEHLVSTICYKGK